MAIKSVKPHDTAADFQKIFDGRQNLMAILHGAQLEAKKLGDLLTALDKVDKLMKQHGNDAGKFANFMTTEKQTVTELVDAPYHSTLCRNCSVVCHNQCGLHEISTDGDNAFRGCYAFSGGDNCNGTQSGGKCNCSYLSHYHGRKTMVTKVNNIETILRDVKAKYDAAVSGQAGAHGQMNSIVSARAQIEASMKAIGSKVMKECEGIRWGRGWGSH